MDDYKYMNGMRNNQRKMQRVRSMEMQAGLKTKQKLAAITPAVGA